ncbi:MAG: ChaN family lipoprotein [Candidatus Methylomirabilales bacterium]
MPRSRVGLRRIRCGAVLLPLLFAVSAFGGAPANECAPIGQWLVPQVDGAQVQPPDGVLTRLAGQRVVLLGETHDNPDHHRWELYTLAGLYALRSQMVLGFEMFPRRVQPALDQWVAGELSEAEFLARTEWEKAWGYEPNFYMPIFHFARMNRIPMVALNVDRSLVSKVADEGWAAIPAALRDGVTDPAPASRAYVEWLYQSYLDHPPPGAAPPAERKPPTEADLAEPRFRRFVEGQLVWDRAMAQAIAERLRGPEHPFVAAIMGSGHLEHGYGVPHQLRDLGVTGMAVALPWEQGTPCAPPQPGLADALFTLQARASADSTERPRLGIGIEGGTGGVVVREVLKGSIAEEAGLQRGDVITTAAGEPVRDTEDVIAAVGRQAPGTWLPLLVKRGDETLEIVARFPPRK